MASGQGITISAKLKLLTDAAELEKTVKSVLSGFDFLGSFFSQDFSSMNSYLKRKAYDKEMGASGDEGAAKAAADKAGFSDKNLETLGLLKDLSEVMKGFGNSIMGFVQGMFGVVEDIYKQMKKSSPLLEMIESLFNLAMTLFFMPLGNKLAEVMLPAILNMLDAVMDIWDKFDNKTLGEMFSIAIVEGVQLIAGYMTNLGTLLEEEGGIVGSIGSLLTVIGNFLAKDGAKIIEFLSKVFEFLMNNVGKLIVLAAEFFIGSLALLAGIYSYLMSRLDWKDIGSKIVSSATVGTVIGAGNAVLIRSGAAGELWNLGGNYASGGHIPATPGGRIIRVAEGGEGEYIVPESKVDTFVTEMIPYSSTGYTTNADMRTSNIRGNVTNNFYFEGLTNDELKTIIREEVNDMISQSKYRGGY